MQIHLLFPAAVCAGVLPCLVQFAAAQCVEPVSTYGGFHTQGIGQSLATHGDGALFGQYLGHSGAYYERLADDRWIRTHVMGGSGSAGGVSMGRVVDLVADLALLGDPFNQSLATSTFHGAAVIYERTTGDWFRAADLYPPTMSPVWFGSAVAIADVGDRVAITARTIPLGGGEVHVFVRQPGGWTGEQVLALTAPVRAVALCQGYLFVGVDSGIGGQVHVFSRIAGTWSPFDVLEPPQLVANAWFGASISRIGDDVLIGAPGQLGTSVTGAVYSYDLSQPAWTGQPAVIAPPILPVTNFGYALDVGGDRLAIGARDRAFEYRRAGGVWQPLATVSPPTGSGYSFGLAVGLYVDGILVGDQSWDDDPVMYPDGPGAVHAFYTTDADQSFRGCQRGIALENGGSLPLEIVWPAQAGKAYQMFGSLSGLGPTAVAGITVPLTPDAYTIYLIDHPALLLGGSGVIDAAGRASASWQIPPGLPLNLDGLRFHHAVIAFDATSLAASNPVTSSLYRIN